MDCSLPGSSVHGISQARILEWVAISSSSRGSSRLRIKPTSPALVGRFFTAEPPGKSITASHWNFKKKGCFYSPLVGSDPRVSGRQLHPSRMAQEVYPSEQCGDGTLTENMCSCREGWSGSWQEAGALMSGQALGDRGLLWEDSQAPASKERRNALQETGKLQGKSWIRAGVSTGFKR